ncbi:MAG: C2 family cysteine protease, partial [Microcoleus sp.]
MTLTFYPDPAQAYQELSSAIPEGQKYTQEGFDYEGKPTRRVEDIYPGVPLFDESGASAWHVGQGNLSNCMILSDLAAMASSSNPYTIEDIIYPNTVSPIGLYMVSIADGLDRKWFPIDSFVPTNNDRPIYARGVDGTTIWPGLIEKAAATLKGNSYASLDSKVIQSPNFYWVPSVNTTCTTFEEILAAVQMGGYGRVVFSKRTDAAGVEIKTPGIVLDHAFGLVSALQVGEHRVLRLSNPWIGGNDYASPLYADDAPFWAENGLLDKVVETTKGGEFWLSLEEFKQLSGSLWSSQMRIPLPHPQLPHSIAFDAEFTDANAVVGNWPSVKSL